MKKLWKVLAIALSLAMCLGVVGNAALTTRFEDVEADKYYTSAFDLLKALKVFNGYEDGSVKPEQSITRAEFAVLLYTALTGEQNADFLKGYSDFADCDPNAWYMGFINYAVGEGIMSGDENGMRPNDTITVAEAARMIISALGYNFKTIVWPSTFMSTAKTQGLFNGITVEFTAGTEATRGFVAVMLYNAIFLDSVKYNTTLNQNVQQIGTSIMERVFKYATFTGNVAATNNLGTAAAAARFDAAHNGYKVTNATGTKAFYAETATQMDAYFGTTVKVFYKADVDANGAYTNSICIPQQGTIESSIVNSITTDAAGNYVINGAAFAPANVLVATVNGGVGTYVQAAPTGTAAYRVFVANGVAYVTPGAVGRYYAELRAGTAKYEFGVAAIATADAGLLAGATIGTGLDLEENAVLNLNKVVSGSYVEYFYDGAVMDAYKLTKSTAKYNAYSENTYKFGDNWYQESAYAGSVAMITDNPTGANTNVYVDSFGKIAYAAEIVATAPGAVYTRLNWALLNKIETSYVFDTTTGTAKPVVSFTAVGVDGVAITGVLNEVELYGSSQAGIIAWDDARWFNLPYIYSVDAATGAYTFRTVYNGNTNCLSSTYFSALGNTYVQKKVSQTIVAFDTTAAGAIDTVFPGMSGKTDLNASAQTGMSLRNTGAFLVAKFAGTGTLVSAKSDAVFAVMTTADSTFNTAKSAVTFYTKDTLPQNIDYFIVHTAIDLVNGALTDVVFLVAPASAPANTDITEFAITNRVVTINAEDATKWDINYSYCKLDGTTGVLTIAKQADPTSGTNNLAIGTFATYTSGVLATVDRAPHMSLYYPGTIDGWYYFCSEVAGTPVATGTQAGFTADCKVIVIAADGSVRIGTTADLKYCAYGPGTPEAGKSMTSIAQGVGYVYHYNVHIAAVEVDANTNLSLIDTIYIYEALCS